MITNYRERGGGLQTGRGGGESEVLPLQKGGGTKSFEEVLTRELEVLAIVMEGRKKFPPFNQGGGAQKVLPCLEGGPKKFCTHDFPIL